MAFFGVMARGGQSRRLSWTHVLAGARSTLSTRVQPAQTSKPDTIAMDRSPGPLNCALLSKLATGRAECSFTPVGGRRAGSLTAPGTHRVWRPHDNGYAHIHRELS
jgi:hypothetical protein